MEDFINGQNSPPPSLYPWPWPWDFAVLFIRESVALSLDFRLDHMAALGQWHVSLSWQRLEKYLWERFALRFLEEEPIRHIERLDVWVEMNNESRFQDWATRWMVMSLTQMGRTWAGWDLKVKTREGWRGSRSWLKQVNCLRRIYHPCLPVFLDADRRYRVWVRDKGQFITYSNSSSQNINIHPQDHFTS